MQTMSQAFLLTGRLSERRMPEITDQTSSRAGKLGALWCAVMHDSTMWPIHSQYQCRTCGRRHPVPWAPENLPGAALKVLVPDPAER